MALSKVNPNLITQGATGRKNLIINGSMDVAQRATTATGVGSADGYFALDRWGSYMGTTGRFTMSQSTDAPIGFAKSMKLDCTTADTSIAAGEYAILRQGIEAHNIKGMARGTSGAKEVTVSFYVKGNASTTYVCEIQDEAGRELSKTFNVTTAWERVELTFPADTNAAAATTYDNTIGVDLYFWIQAGSNYTSGTIPTTWANQSNANRVAGIGNFFSSTSNELYIAGVQLEVGSVATDFEHRSFGEELALCQRYFSKSNNHETAPADGSDSQSISIIIDMASNLMRTGTIYFPTQMRVSPSVTRLKENGVGGGSSGQWAWFQSGVWTYGAPAPSNITNYGFSGHMSSTSGTSDGRAYWMHINWKAEAEL